MSKEQAEGFYAEHKERPFFGALVDFMTSGPVMVQVLEGENAVVKNREIMGATNPADAAAGTLRSDYFKGNLVIVVRLNQPHTALATFYQPVCRALVFWQARHRFT